MTRQIDIIAEHAADMSAREVAVRFSLNYDYVRAAYSRLRRRGKATLQTSRVRIFPDGKRPSPTGPSAMISIGADGLLNARSAAAARGVTVSELLQMACDKLMQDNLFDAVLDDREGA